MIPIHINNYDQNGGLNKYNKPFLQTDQAFTTLENAYVWRDSVKKRDGIDLIGRLRRAFINLSEGPSQASPWTFNILTVTGFVETADNANPGQITTKFEHNLTTGDQVVVTGILGATGYNDTLFTITVVDDLNFTVGVDAGAFGAYLSGGQWISNRSLLGIGGIEPDAQIEPGSFFFTIGNINFTDLGDGTITQTGTITGATQANPCEITSNNHNLVTGTDVTITSVQGMTELNGNTYTITVTGVNTFTLDGVDSTGFTAYIAGGTWTATYATSPNSATINYVTGEVVITHTAGVGVATTLFFNYFPTLPVMGIWQREVVGINRESTIFWDTRYAYVNAGTGFTEFQPGTVWHGTDSDFFWATNYRGSDAAARLFFATNFNNTTAGPPAEDPIFYTDGGPWVSFKPAVASIVFTESLGNANGAVFNGTLTNLPIVTGSVKITVGTVTFTDANKDGTLTGRPSANTGTIDYETGDIVLNFNPALGAPTNVEATYRYGITFMLQARILIPYYGRLLALNTWEGTDYGPSNSKNFFNRCRFSQIGNPIQDDAWISDVFGKGGFIDAPINEEIISATFFKNTLIVGFETSTWQLRYVGEYGLPFIWERISSDFGCESTFSSLLFDDGVRSVGDRAITAATAINVDRIDLQIPDTVFNFKNSDDGPKRVIGIRDYRKELVYWCYPDGQSSTNFPNRTLLYNYRNNTFAIFRDNITFFGIYQSPNGITWDSLDTYWDDPVPWDDPPGKDDETIVIGNQQGYVHGYESRIASPLVGLAAYFDQSLSITAIDLTAEPIELTVPNHNLVTGEIIYLTGLLFVDALDVPVETNLNNEIYRIIKIDNDTLSIQKWDGDSYGDDFVVTPPETSVYIGGGELALFPVMNVSTKDFNPFQDKGLQMKLSRIDFLNDAADASFTIKIFMNSSLSVQGNVITGQKQSSTSLTQTGFITNVTQANPAVVTSPNHGLRTGNEVSFVNIKGMTELVGPDFFVTYLTPNTFSLNVDSSAFTAYQSGGMFILQSPKTFYVPGSEYAWHSFYATLAGQYIRVMMTYDDDLLNQIETHKNPWTLNAMTLMTRRGGKICY